MRTGKTVGDTAHSYLYASGKLLRESYGNTVLDFFYDASGMPYAFQHNDTLYYYITNLQGDVVQIVDAQGNTVASYDYDPYGKVIAQTGDLAQINPLRYRGYYYDTETGFYYLQSRYYDPELRRFINADGLASTGHGILGTNMFAYCLNNPVNMLDCTGSLPVFIEEAWDWLTEKYEEGKELVAEVWEAGTEFVNDTIDTTMDAASIAWDFVQDTGEELLFYLDCGWTELTNIDWESIFIEAFADSIAGFVVGFGIGLIKGAAVAPETSGVSIPALAFRTAVEAAVTAFFVTVLSHIIVELLD